jgi:hypothetical protein
VGVVVTVVLRRRPLFIAAVLVGVVLCGVTALNGVVSAKSVSVRGGVCLRGGAATKDSASGRGLVCVRTKAGVLRWQFRPVNPTSTTVVTATTVPASTTTSAAPLAPVVVSASAINGVNVTVAGMRPDTGVYSLQWVLKGSTFNTYQMARATSPSMSVPSGWFMCNRTYTFRVFTMRADWQLADGHQTQNVTPHSTEFDLVMPECPASVVLTCAQGGVCVVGDTGPGGGIVFYVATSSFASAGSTCNTACRYLEAAPANWLADTTGDPFRSWATDGNQTTAVVGADGTAIGSGYQNTLDIVAQTGNEAATSAAVLAHAYRGNSKSDWHLPSKDELNQMCKWQRGVAWISDATVCTGGTLNSGAGASGFVANIYWSSSELDASNVWFQRFDNGDQSNRAKSFRHYVRPVRAF